MKPIGPPPFVQNIIAQKGSPPAAPLPASPDASAAPPDWMIQMIQAQMAKKAMKAAAAAGAPAEGGAPVNQTGTGGTDKKRDATDGTAAAPPALPAPAGYPPNPYGYPYPYPPPFPFGPPFPMGPFGMGPVMPFWKLG